MTSIPCFRSASGLAVLLLLALGACTDPAGLGRDDAPIQTDELAYRLVERSLFLETRIEYTYRNAGLAPIFIQNCNGAYGILLEQRREGDWHVVWGNATPDCLSPAIAIGPGQELEGVLVVRTGLPQCGCGSFETPEIDGVYRMVVTEAFDGLDPNGFAAGQRVDLDRRVSNRFMLTR